MGGSWCWQETPSSWALSSPHLWPSSMVWVSSDRGGSAAGTPQGLSGLMGSHRISLDTGTSLLERLMLHNPLYKKSSGGYDAQFITKLLWNYRWGQGWCRKGLSQAGIDEHGTPGSVPQSLSWCGRWEHTCCPGC